MPKYHIERSIRINTPIERVRQLTTNFKEWPVWSPWLSMEPEANLEFFGDAGEISHGYTWSGELVGAGEMKTSAVTNSDNKCIQQLDLTFLKPFRSTAKVELHLEAADKENTDVTWHMDSALPFFLFFMTSNIKSMIGMDYERGLRMLKEYAETGKVNSSVEIAGITEVPATPYTGLERESDMAGLAEQMKLTFPKIEHFVGSAQLPRAELIAGNIYREMILKKQFCRYTAILPLQTIEAVNTQGSDMVTGTISPCKAIKVIHRGSYVHLGNAWGAAMSFQRYKKHKLLKQQPPFEFYLNDPRTTAEEDLLTEIYVPVKG